MRKVLIVGFAALVVILAGCTALGSKDYFPLSLNSTWKNVLTTVTTIRGSIDTTYTTADTSTVTVVAETTLAGKKAWKMETQTVADAPSYHYYVEESDRLMSYSSPTDSSPTTLLKLPLAQNATWVADSTTYTGVLTATVIGKDAVTAPAGTFSDAWKVAYAYDSMPTAPFHYWFAGNVGLAKWHFANTYATPDDTTDWTMTQELVSYTVK
jgi:hypothetical protein